MLDPRQFPAALQPTAKFIQSGRIAEARQLLRQILEADPRNADGWYLVSLTTDQIAQKTKALERALKLNPQHALAKQALADFNTVDEVLSAVGADLPRPQATSRPTTQAATTPGKNRKQRGIFIAAAVIGLLLMALFVAVISDSSPIPGTSPSIRPSMPGARGSIVFDMAESSEWEDRDIYIMEASSLNPVDLTPGDAEETSPALSPDGTQIAFMSNRDAFSDIYVMNTDGSNLRRLTFDVAPKDSPAWSPDSKRILYEKLVQGNWAVYVMNADGSDDKPLLKAEDQDYSDAAWSPDGTRVVYVAYTGGSVRPPNRNIFVVDTDGSNGHQLTTNNSDNYAPAWSPDSRRILFTSEAALPARGISIYVMDTDGQNQTQLIKSGSNARWSPDGERIIYTDFKPEAAVKLDQLFAARADGSNRILLTDFQGDYESPSWGIVNPATATTSAPSTPSLPYEIVFAPGGGDTEDHQLFVIDASCAGTPAGCAVAAHPLVESDINVTYQGRQPAWSPDGSKVAFIIPGENSMEVAVFDTVTQQKQILTDDALEDQYPVWSPDGTRIAFAARSGQGDPNIYVMDADGQRVTQLTTSDENEWPAWSPDGKQIAYVSNASGIGCDNIFVMDADGSHQRKLTDNCDDNNRPIWMPDGDQILFQTRPEHDGNGWLFIFAVINADGSNKHELTIGTRSYDTIAAWTPDGQYLLLSDINIYLVRPDGSFVQRLILKRSGDGLAAPASARMTSR